MKTRRKHIVLFFATCVLHTLIFSQNQPLFDQYHFNQLVLNPAYAGSKGNVEANLFYRQQWTKMDGAPESISGTVHMNAANDKLGMGLKILQESIGATNKLQLGLQYAYRIHVSNTGVLALGIDVSATNYQLNFQELTAYQVGDPAFIYQPENTWSPNVGAGIWFNTNKIFAGISSPVILEDTISGVNNDDISQLNIFEAGRHYYFSAGILIGNIETFAIKPYTLVKYAPDAPVQVDASLSFIFKNNFWLGGSYRTNSSISLMGQYFLKRKETTRENNFGIGYAYNMRIDEFQNYFGPSHEIFGTWQFNKKQTKYTNPRFF
ncbi:MAG: type IX secretion system membrane protein PorP/SprF [Chitinophagales bacterium]